MNVSVRFYSRLRDLAGDSTECGAAPGTTAGDLLTMLYRRHPALEEWDPHIRVAAGLEWVERDYVLREGEEVSIMPPVQGG